MSGRSPARLLAPLALIGTIFALFTVLSGGGGGDETEAPAGSGARPAATAPSGNSPSSSKKSKRTKRYTVKAGDTPSSIADEAGIPLERLLELNPDIDPQALSPGQRLKLGP